MACFLFPTTETIVVTVITKAVKSKEPEHVAHKDDIASEKIVPETKIPFSRKQK